MSVNEIYAELEKNKTVREIMLIALTLKPDDLKKVVKYATERGGN